MDSSLTLAVIAPQVPLLLQLLLPLLLAALGAFLLSIPRLTLTLAHCLYFRLVPRRVIDRSLRDVQGRGFQGLTTAGFLDRYTIRTAGCQDELRHAVIDFFEQRGARIETSPSKLVFTRGSRFCSYFLSHIVPCPETRFLQRITVDFGKGTDGEFDVGVNYAVRAFCMLRVMPSGLQAEVGALRDELNTRHGPLRTHTE